MVILKDKSGPNDNKSDPLGLTASQKRRLRRKNLQARLLLESNNQKELRKTNISKKSECDRNIDNIKENKGDTEKLVSCPKKIKGKVKDATKNPSSYIENKVTSNSAVITVGVQVQNILSINESVTKCQKIKNQKLKVEHSVTNQETEEKIPTTKVCIDANPEICKEQKIIVKENKFIPKMSSPNVTKSREEILAEREAKKLAKLAAKNKIKAPTCDILNDEKSSNKEESKTQTSLKSEKNKAIPNKDKTIDEVDRALPARVTELETQQKAHKSKSTEKQKIEKVLTANEGKKCAEPGEGLADQTSNLKNIDSLEASGKSKAELKAERRAKQEAQRAAKEATKKQPKPSEAPVVATKAKPEAAKEEKKTPTKQVEKVKAKTIQSTHKVNWFQHLYAEREKASKMKIQLNSKDIHPAIVKLGVQYSTGVVTGANARCVALLNALKQVVSDFVVPARSEFARALEAALSASTRLVWCTRPPCATMLNAVKHVRAALAHLPHNVAEMDAKCILHESIDTYIRDQIDVAGEAISIAVRKKISHGDTILTYGCSSLIEKILVEAWSSGLKFRVVVVGSRSNSGGREMLRRLTSSDVPATYVNICAINYVMRSCQMVVVGCCALLMNGWVVGACGTAQVALAARAYCVPVLVAAETHKFTDRVLTDAFVYNEIGDPDALIDRSEGEDSSPLRDWRSLGTLTPLNLTYDVTPPTLVTALVTELALLPCTSAPVVLRFKLNEYALA